MGEQKREILGSDTRRLFKIGGSLAVTIPKEYVEAHGLKEGDRLQVFYDEVFHAEPIKKELILEKLGKKRKGGEQP